MVFVSSGKINVNIIGKSVVVPKLPSARVTIDHVKEGFSHQLVLSRIDGEPKLLEDMEHIVTMAHTCNLKIPLKFMTPLIVHLD